MKVFRDMFEDVRCVPQVNLAIKSWVCILHFQFLLDLGKVFPWSFVGGLPMSRRGHAYLYVVVDRFRKMCTFMPCTTQVTAKQATQLFFQNVWVHFGLPKSIISDRDSRFVGSFWSSLWALKDTKLKKSTTFHPQTDG
jgi:hypothetical protein